MRRLFAGVPVEHGGDVVVVAQHAVVQAIVAVDDRRALLVWDPRGQRVVHLVHERDGALGELLGLLELAVPAVELAADVVLLLAEVTEPDGVDAGDLTIPSARVVEGRFGALRVDVAGRTSRFRYQTVDGRVRDDFRLSCSSRSVGTSPGG